MLNITFSQPVLNKFPDVKFNCKEGKNREYINDTTFK